MRFPSRILSVSIATLILAAGAKPTARAQTSGTWNVDANGNWSAPGSWVNGIIPDGTDATANFRFNLTANRTVTLDGGSRTVGNLAFEDVTTASHDWILSSNPTSNVLTLDVTTGPAMITVVNRTATINTILAGNDGINVTGGAGTLILAGANIFTGGLTVSSGIVQLNNASAAGADGITVATSSNSAVANRLVVNGNVTIANDITIQSGAAPGTGLGALMQVGTGQATINGAVTIGGGAVNGGHFVGGNAVGSELVLNGAITATGEITQRTGRVIYRGGGNGYTGLTITGTGLVGANNGIPTGTTVTLGISGNGTLDLNGFDQTLAGLLFGNPSGANAGSIATVAVGARTLTLNGNLATRGTTPTHSITGTGTLNLGATASVFTIGDNTPAEDFIVAPMIAGTAGFTKDGDGTLILNGNVTNTGPITISTGALGGDSTISGAVSVGVGATIMAGTASRAGTMTLSSLAVDASVVSLNIGTTNDFINVTAPGGLRTTNQPTTINIFPLGGPLPVGTYNLIGHNGAIQGAGLAGFALRPLGHSAATLVDVGGVIKVNVTSTDAVTWNGALDGTWDLNLGQNWTLRSTNAPTAYLEGDDVIFSDSGANTTITLDGPVNPARITFTNTAAVPYTIAGFGGIQGTAVVNKTGNGTVTLRTANTYTGPTTVQAGTLELDHDSPTGVVLSGNLGGVSVAAGATLALTRDDGDIAFTRDVSGAGTVTVDPHTASGGGVRSVTLSGNNTLFSGLWRFLANNLGAGSGSYRTVNTSTNATTLGTAAIDIDTGAQLWIADTTTLANNVTISGTGYSETGGGTPIGLIGTQTNGVYVGAGTALFPYAGIGAIRFGANNVLTGNLVADGNAKIMAFNTTATIAGNISSTSAADTLVIGGGTSGTTVIFTGTNSYGKTLVNGGSGTSAGTHALQIGNNGTTGTLGTGEVVLFGNSAAVGEIRFNRADGYTLLPGQHIVGAGAVSGDLARTRVLVNSRGTGLTLNDNNIDLSDGTGGGALHVGGVNNANGIAGAILNITGSSLVDTGTFFVGDQTNVSGTVNQSGTSTVNVLTQMRLAHWPTETGSYNLNGGSLTINGTPAVFPFATASPQETVGGIYVGIDGAGLLTQTAGTLATNFLVLDNRAETNGGLNMPSGTDTYALSGGTLILKNAFGIISRYASTAVNLSGGTIQAATGVSPNLDTARITVGGPVTLDTNGANTFTLYGPLGGTGTVSLVGGGTFRTQDGTGTTLTAAGGGMPGGSLGTASLNIGATSTLQANRTGQDIWSGALSGAGTLVKLNSGQLSISGNGTAFTGTARVSAGRLDLPTSFGASAITVADGASLGGEPTTTEVTFGTTTGSNLFFNGATAGALTATNLAVNGTTTVDFSAPPSAAGPVTVLNYTNRTGTGTFALANAANYRSATVEDPGTGRVTVNVTTKNLTWTGSTTAAWNVKTDANWSDGAAPEMFFAGDTVTFDDTATTTAVNVASGVSPWRTAVNSATNNYTFTSTGTGIAGPGNLEKSGASTLTLVGANTYSGRTVLSGGRLSIAAATSLGNGGPGNGIAIDGGTFSATATMDLGARAINVGANGATFIAPTTAAVTVTIPGNLSGTGPLTFASGGSGAAPIYVLGGDGSAFSGNVTVDSAGATAGGTALRLTSSNAITSGTITLLHPTVSTSGSATSLDLVNVTLGSGVTVVMNTLLSGANSYRAQINNSSGTATVNSRLVLNGNAIAQFSTAGFMTLNGNVTAGEADFTGTMFLRGSGAGVVNGVINLPNGILAKTDASTWTINSTGNTWTTTSVFNAGSVRLGATNALPITANLNIGQGSDASASTLDLNGFNQEVPNITYTPGNANSARGITNTSTTPSTLTVNNPFDVTYGATSGITGGILAGNLTLVKNGAGTLTLGGANTFTGNVTVNAGTLVAAGSTATTLGSPTTAGRTVTMNSGTTLSFTTNNVFGNGINNNNLPSLVMNDATLTSTRYNVLGNLTLNGATLTQEATDSGNFEGFQFRGNVQVTGTAPSVISTGNGKANHLNASTAFNVADVTASAVADLIISTPLRNQSGDFGSAAGGLSKLGAGTMELTGINSYTGVTSINEGTLLVSGTIAGDTTVNSAGTLAGTGTLAAVSVIGGTVAPGTSPGTLTTGAFSLDSASRLKFELAQPGVVGGGINDLISVVGNLTLDGTLQVTELAGFRNGSYRLFDYAGSLSDNSLAIEGLFLAAHPGSRIDTTTPGQVNLVVIPEPGTASALVIGMGLLLGLRRRATRTRQMF